VLAVMLRINAKLALYVLILVPIAVVLISWFQKRLVALNRVIREVNSKITGNFNEGITGARSIKTLVIEDTINDDFKKDTSEMKRTSVHATHYSAMFSAAVTMMSSAALAIVLWKGGSLTMEGVLRIGTLSVFVSYALGMMEPIQNIIATISALIAIQVNIERLTNLLAAQSDVADRPEVIEKYGDTHSIIIMADHGGHERGHGSEMPEDMTVPFFFYGSKFEPGKELYDVSLLEIAPTIASILEISPDSQWEGRDLTK
jgi:ATP-binding cassette subfamily B protein